MDSEETELFAFIGILSDLDKDQQDL